MRITVNAMPENRNFSPDLSIEAAGTRDKDFASPGNLSSEKIDRYPNLWTKKSNLFSVEQRATAKRLSISFITVQDFPHPFAEDAIHFYFDDSRLFEDPGVSVLNEPKTSKHTMPVKLEILQDKVPLLREGAAAQGTIHGQKG
jgi:hypothetical protein